jgi:hypothetical protein
MPATPDVPNATLAVRDGADGRLVDVLVDGELIARIPTVSATYRMPAGKRSVLEVRVDVSEATVLGGEVLTPAQRRRLPRTAARSRAAS